MTDIIIPIHPEWCKKIFDREKPVEVRMTAPEPPFKARIYATKPTGAYSWALCRDKDYGIGLTAKCNYGAAERLGIEILSGKVVGEFICYKVDDFSKWEFDYPSLLRHIDLYAGTGGDFQFLDKYLKGQKKGCGWHISDLVVYDKPKELSDFGLSRAPQSWCYVKEPLCTNLL